MKQIITAILFVLSIGKAELTNKGVTDTETLTRYTQ